MPMPRSLSKVQKHISKKRGGRPNTLHENSRDAKSLRRAGAREDKLARLLDAAQRANQGYVDRIAWFKTAIEGSEGPLSDEEMHVLTESFIARSQDELADVKSQRRPGRPASKAEEQIQAQIFAEEREFKSGFWVPDLRDEEGRQKLEVWSNDWAGLNSLKFIRIVKGGAIRSSSFPPKGLSCFTTHLSDRLTYIKNTVRHSFSQQGLAVQNSTQELTWF